MNIFSRTIIALLPFLLYTAFNIYLFIRDTNNLYSIIIFVLTIVGVALGMLYTLVLERLNIFLQLAIMTLITYLVFVASLYAKALDESAKNINHGKIWLNALYSAMLFAGMFSIYLFLLRPLLDQPFQNIMTPSPGEPQLEPTMINMLLYNSVPIAGNLIMMLYISSSASFFGEYNG
jgi:hypothetical protein